MKKDRKLFVIVLLTVLVALGFSTMFDQQSPPMSAAGMSVEQRVNHDQEVINDYLIEEFDSVKKVEVDHKYNSVKIKTSIKKSEQYAENTGEEIRQTLKDILKEHAGELTIEEDYLLFIYSDEGFMLAQ